MRSHSQRGLAIVIVFSVLTALFLLSLPFVRSMHQSRESANNYKAQLEAKQDARSAQALALAYLRQIQKLNQQILASNNQAAQRWIANTIFYGGVPFNTPKVDTFYEHDAQRMLESLLITPAAPNSQPGPALEVLSARGRLWTIRVADEQAKINLDTATPWLLGNLMGGTVLVNEVKDTDVTITVADGSWLEPRGFVWIDGELIGYDGLSGGGQNWTLTGCKRGLNQQLQPMNPRGSGAAPLPPDPEFVRARVHLRGTPVVPGIAYKLFRYKLEPALQARAKQYLGLQATDFPALWFKDISSIREVSEFQKFDGGPSESVLPDLFTQVRDHLTVFSTAPFALNFFNPHVLMNNQPTPNTRPTLQLVACRGVPPQVDDTVRINPGSIVRIRNDQGQVELALVTGIGPNRIFIDRHLSNTFLANRAIVEVMARHPININTASEEVLRAVLQGLRIQGNDSVSPDEARRVAAAIYNRIRDPRQPTPFIDEQDFATFINQNYQQWALSSADVQAILLNAQTNTDPRLLSPTAPFCYQSFDTYTVETVGTRCSEPIEGGPGIPLASFATRQVLSVGAPGAVGRWEQRELADLSEMRSLPIGNGLLLTTRGNTNGRTLARVELPIKPNQQPPRGSGAGNFRFTDFPGLGQQITGTAGLPVDVSNLGQIAGSGPGMDLQAGYLQFWIRPDDIDSNGMNMFDLSETPISNRFSLFFDGQRRAMVLRMKDASLENAFVDLVFPSQPQGGTGPAFRDGNWYHFCATWKGTPFQQLLNNQQIPAQMNLLVDAMGCTPTNRTPSYQTFTFYDSAGNYVERHGELAQDLWRMPGNGIVNTAQPWHEVVLTNASAFPPQGVVEIGGEVISYTVKNGNTLTGTMVPELDAMGNPTGRYFMQGFARGVRGTSNRFHINGSRVNPFGYSAFIVSHPESPHLPAARGNSIQTCGMNTGPIVLAYLYNPDNTNTTYLNYQNEGPLAGLTAGMMELRVPPGLTADFPDRGYLLLRGQAIERYDPVPPPGSGMRAVFWNNSANCAEIVYYDGKGTGGTPPNNYETFRIVQRNALTVNNPGSSPACPPTGFHFPNVASVNPLSVTLISWEVSDLNKYHDRGYVQIDDNNEIIRYTEKDQQRRMFVFNDAQATTSVLAWRGQFGTGVQDHRGVAKALPLFHVQGKPGIYNYPCSTDDPVTVVLNKNSNKVNTGLGNNAQPLLVRWSFPVGQNNQWVTLNDFVNTDYIPGNGTRLMRFPSGELPVDLPTTMRLAGRTGGGGLGTPGYVDEIECEGFGAGDFRLWSYPSPNPQPPTGPLLAFDSNGQLVTRVYVNSIAGLHRDCGVIRVGDELIAYRETGFEDIQIQDSSQPSGFRTVRRYYLDRCVRGFLGTRPSNHDVNSLFLNLANIRIGKLNGALPSDTGFSFQIQGENTNFPLDQVGYALTGSSPFNMEVIGYIRKNNRFAISEYSPDQRGLFRGRFGTTPVQTVNDALIVGLPYRYLDRYCDPNRLPMPAGATARPVTFNSPEQFVVGGTYSAPRCRWLRVRWQIADDARLRGVEGDHIEIQLLLKPSTVVSWEDPQVRKFIFRHNDRIRTATGRREPDSREGGVTGLQQVDDIGGVVADGMEWRVAFVFTDDAFRFDSWKWTPAFFGLYFEYERNEAVYKNQEIPR